MRDAMIGWMVVAALLLGLSIGRAADGNETTMTVQVSSAEHETDEGYFSLGKDATVMAKPGTELHRFLARQNGKPGPASRSRIGRRPSSSRKLDARR